MEISKKDRLFLINQYRILAALEVDSADHYKELIEILESGYEIFYSKLDEWISDDMPTDKGRFVIDVLNLYRAIEDLKRSSKDARLTEHRSSFFKGFDGNNETEYMAFARFLIEDQKKFSEQLQYLGRNDHLNSHCRMKENYERMLTKASQIDSIWSMSVEQATEILEA